MNRAAPRESRSPAERRAPLFAVGDRIILCGELPRSTGVVHRLTHETCPEHGDYVYRCDIDGGYLAGLTDFVFCESVMAKANEQ